MPLVRDTALLALGAGIHGFRRVRGLFVPDSPSTPARSLRRSRPRGRRSYDGAAAGYRTDGWLAHGTDANAEVLGGLARLRDRSRDLVRNNPTAARAIRSLTHNLVGKGIRPLPQTGNADLDKRIAALFDRWSRQCYPSNRSTFYTLESLAVRAFLESGETLIRLRPRRVADMPGLPPLQLQVLEGDHLPLDDLAWARRTNGNRIEQGVEFDPLDRRAAYHLYRTHPGSTALSRTPSLDTVRVPASSVVHLYQELRPGQIRGVPWLAPVVLALWDLGGYQDAERVRARANALIAAFVEGGNPDDEDDESNPDGIAGHTDENGDLVTDSDGYPVESLRPGLVAYLPTGKTIKLSNPGTPGGFIDYVKAHLREIASGIGLSYEALTGDLSGTNYSSIKFGQNEQNRMVEALREQVVIPFLLDPIYEAVIDAAVASGLLPDVPEVYTRTWSRPLLSSIDRIKDAAASLTERRAGLRSLREIVSSDYGRDFDDVVAEIEAENADLDAKGLILDSDPRRMTNAGIAQYIRETSVEAVSESA